jgi:phospholipid transport system substrate-binding protein
MIRSLLAALAMFVVLVTSQTAFAGEATDTVKAKQEQLFKIIATPKSDARQAKLKALFDEMLAYDKMARHSLGKKWDELTDAQKKKFTETLTDIIRGNYRRNLTKMLDYKIEYTGEKTQDGNIVVKTVAKHKKDSREPPIEIDFVVAKIDGKWKVVDIITERASLVKTYKSQFLKILKKDGFDKLIEKMKKKRDDLEKE